MKKLNYKSIAVFCLTLFFILLIPILTHAQTPQSKFVPCDGVTVPCDFGMLMKLVSNVIGFAVELAFPLAVITFAWAGFTLMLNPTNSSKRSEAKNMMIKVAIGFGVLLAAWLIVKLVLSVFLNPTVIQQIPLEGVQ